MNIFFYAASSSSTSKECLEKLQKISALERMTILSGQSLFLSPLSLNLRSGDLIILFAANREDLNELVALQHDFKDFRIILILEDRDNATVRKAHLLQPSYITFAEEQSVSLEAVINKMTGAKTLMAKNFVKENDLEIQNKYYNPALSREESA